MRISFSTICDTLRDIWASICGRCEVSGTYTIKNEESHQLRDPLGYLSCHPQAWVGDPSTYTIETPLSSSKSLRGIPMCL